MTDSARYIDPRPMSLEPATLEGRIVRLVPMERSHADALLAAASFPQLWRWTATTPMSTPDEMRAYMDTALGERAAGRALPFVTVELASGEIIGSTRFANVSVNDRRVEIGWSWIRPDRQRTGANSEAKALMLKHAFDVLGALRVEIKADALNARSRAAIERLGGSYEGTLRQHMVVLNGRVRDTVYYSILDTEWRDPNHRAYQHAMEHGLVPDRTPRVPSEVRPIVLPG